MRLFYEGVVMKGFFSGYIVDEVGRQVGINQAAGVCLPVLGVFQQAAS
jgi:hypothetical protein